MTEPLKNTPKKPSFWRFRPGKKSMLALVLVSFMMGYSSMIYLRNNACSAAFLPPPPPIFIMVGSCAVTYPCPICGCVGLCDPVNTSNTIKTTDENLIDQLLKNLTDKIPPWLANYTTGTGTFTLKVTGYGDDGFIGGEIDVMMQSLLTRLNDTELDLIDWWDTMWWYNLRPAMQAMTRQLNTATSQQAEDFQSGMDAFQEDETNLEDMKTDNQNHQATRVSESACVAATASGGFGRVSNYSRAMRAALQDDVEADGQNRLYTSGATPRASANGRATKLKQDAKTFETTFCDPQDNDGHNVPGCAAPTDKHGNSYANADVQVTKNLFNKLTMQVDDPADGANETKVAQAVLNNEMGDPTGDPIPANAMASAQGHQLWLDRRSYLARYAAIRSVPQLLEGWRMPGSKLGPWIKEIEEDAGVSAADPQGEMSDNPSYREIVHAIAIDKFNSGKYANNMITDENEIEMEKLTVNTFYLMQLRDYYELLEREALTLSVQVSLMAEKVPKYNPMEEQPVRR